LDAADHDRNLTFLKLGGSLLTEKGQEATARSAAIDRLAGEISDALQADPHLRLLIGHGSGSFGHPPASRFGTRAGVRSDQDWHGFVEVWRMASALHRIVLDALKNASIAALSFPPSCSVITRNGELITIASDPIEASLSNGLVPVVMGDVVFDTEIGGTILSTEQIFLALTPPLKPRRILLAGAEVGVYAQYPAQGEPLSVLRERDLGGITLMGSEHSDVTGGMADKVQQAFALLRLDPTLEIRIFSPERPGSLRAALLSEPMGTRVQP
jgi:isopentenyl phosphate kinase